MATKKTDPKPSAPKTKVKKETKNLKTVISAEELAAFAEELATTTQLLDRLEEEKKSRMADIKHKIDEATARQGRLANIVATKSEYRLVDCQVVLDFEDKTYTVTRLDTGEIVEERPLFESELQRTLPLE